MREFRCRVAVCALAALRLAEICLREVLLDLQEEQWLVAMALLSSERQLQLEKVFVAKVRSALVYDTWDKHVSFTIDAYDEASLLEWGTFFGAKAGDVEIEFAKCVPRAHTRAPISFSPSHLFCREKKKPQTVTFWKVTFDSVRQLRCSHPSWWVRHHGTFRSVVMLNKGGLVVSLGGTSTPSFVSSDSDDSTVYWDTAESTRQFFVKVKMSTTLLRVDNTIEDQSVYTREARPCEAM